MSLVRERLDPAAGRLLHVAGSVVAGDLVGALRAEGFSVDRTVLYEARPAAGLSAPSVRALAAGIVDFALFFSPRTASIFVRLAERADVAEVLGTVAAISISGAADAALEPTSEVIRNTVSAFSPCTRNKSTPISFHASSRTLKLIRLCFSPFGKGGGTMSRAKGKCPLHRAGSKKATLKLTHKYRRLNCCAAARRFPVNWYRCPNSNPNSSSNSNPHRTSRANRNSQRCGIAGQSYHQ